jgi:hypothetical protein
VEEFMKKLESFIKTWGLHICCVPSILAFLCMALNNYVNEEQTLIYVLSAGLVLSIYLFFWCERINVELLEKSTALLKRQHARQLELVQALRDSDRVLNEQDKQLRKQDELMEDVLNLL